MQKLDLFKQFNPLAVALRLLPGRGRLLMLAVAALLTMGLMTVFNSGLDTLEERLGAQGWVLSPDETTEERVIIVAIDEQSLAEVGAWPWSRTDMARLVTALNEYGVQLQLHDINYPEAREGDDALIAALQASRGAVIAQAPVLQSEQQVQTGQMTHALTGISCDAGAQASSFVAPHAGFAGIAKGHIAPLVASDGSLRKIPAFVCVGGQVYPALVISALLQATSASSWNASLESGRSWFGPE
ncbi:MAG: CHASE2 domain-containing protein, partial [Gammaproteobacteria bacterium]|nr:CHASE2 domain-containing protein [Gammaproteobacteria bacterium]